MLIDGHGRVVDYLRVSVTQRCNFRCRYCMPKTPFEWTPKENLLSFEELFLFIKVAIDEGVKKIRITGGEPLLRKDLDVFIKMINDYNPNVDLALTTNGFMLKHYAKRLKEAGLKRINMSLDTLKPEVAKTIAQKSVLHEVLAGFEEALDAGLSVKINTVALKGINDNEIINLLEFAKFRNCQIRFIEYMENSHANDELKGLKSDEILSIISKKYKITKDDKLPNAPASIYKLEDGYKFGIIDPHKHDFCESCNRIRLTAEGFLIPCLYFEDAMSIKDAVTKGDVAGAAEVLRQVLINKPEKNKWEIGEQNETSSRAFYQTGG
ncbi:GTP 3',8-cyclase MoaA [Campylobacter pinnipediorum]|uniref:GTP 3',8-cyclase MoaA n=1 Tax=Campylobacter pinnipediorum TaxID=1965231 RepID=UPI00084D6BED|nr:GTP 3',8-cyclase MoaA [Campylobacter pinnipediorum]AQW83121.1 molybdenum cofactor biosynthesis protein A [Campylobacter pinnipediorum subsp. pinnipediorum]